MSDPNLNKDNTQEWERELDRQKKPKIKFPIKATGENMNKVNLDFSDPEIPIPKKAKEKKETSIPNLVDLSKNKKKKSNKTKLF